MLVIDESEAGHVRNIFDLFLIEGSLYRAAAKLREQKVPCRPSDNEKNERNQSWNVQNLASVLRSYHYAGLREVNKQNKSKPQADLAPHEKYQVVKAAWSGIVPEATFFAVQKVLDDNQKLERVRRNGSAKRNFLLTGVAYCHECGRPLVGSTGHGSGGEVQYYLHRPIEGKLVTCEVKRFRAEIAESAIENHFLRVVLREGYLDGLAQELEKNSKSLHKDKVAERIALEQKIVQADKDLTRLIKLQMQTDDDELRELYSDQLKVMKDQRKADAETVETLKEAEELVVDPTTFKNAIEFNMRSLQKAWDKASPSLRKKLLRAVVNRLEFRPDGIDIHYYPVQANLLAVQSNQSSESTGAKPVDLASFRKSKEKQKADLTASNAGLADNAKVSRWYIVGNGCGSLRTSHLPQVPDKIRLSNFTKQAISERARDLYRSGASLQAIANEVGCSKTLIRETLLNENVVLRAHSHSQLGQGKKSKAISIRNAPYGFCLVNGALVEDPREMAAVALMVKWWNQGMSYGAIARKLNSQKIKPRKAASWSQPTVGFIIQRQPNINRRS